MAYPSFFLGEVPELPEEYAELTVSEVWSLAYQAGSQHTVDHLNTYWQELLVTHRGQISRVYNDLVKIRLDWLYDIFSDTTPNPTGESA